MRPLTLERPKPLIEVAGRPLIEHVLTALPPSVAEIIIIVGYKGEMIKSHLGAEHQGRPIRYVTQDVYNGTARALTLARPFLAGKFLLLAADDIHGAAALEAATTHPLALLVSEHSEPERFGVVIPTTEGTLGEIVEKPEHPQGNLVSTGAMVLDTDIFSHEAERHTSGEYYLTGPLGLLARARPIALVTQPLWIPVGRPEDIGPAEALLAAHTKTHL